MKSNSFAGIYDVLDTVLRFSGVFVRVCCNMVEVKRLCGCWRIFPENQSTELGKFGGRNGGTKKANMLSIILVVEYGAPVFWCFCEGVL